MHAATNNAGKNFIFSITRRPDRMDPIPPEIYRPPRTESTLQSPPPCVEMNRKTKQ